jgi:hypothetical protein
MSTARVAQPAPEEQSAINLVQHVMTILQPMSTFRLRTGTINDAIPLVLAQEDKVAQRRCSRLSAANPSPGICPRSSLSITPSQARQAFSGS